MMTIPGVGLYYAGMVDAPKVHSTIFQTFSIACVITLSFFIFGYSLSLGPPAQGSLPVQPNQHSSLYYGDASRLWYWGIGGASVHQNAPTVPESVYCTFQLSFAILTAALVCSSFADRIKFVAMLVFTLLWHLAVYCPIAHAAW
jgi:Amt family ammonium transporter